MAKDLTSSRIDRQNVLNNELALQEIQDTSNIRGIVFEGKVCLTKSMVASFFDIEARTIERYVSDNADELMKNGYEILRGQRLKTFIRCVQEQEVLKLAGKLNSQAKVYPGGKKSSTPYFRAETEVSESPVTAAADG